MIVDDKSTLERKTLTHDIRSALLVGFHKDRTDAQLLELFLLQKDEDAFASLVQRHGSMVWGVCHRVLNHTQEAEDAFQATFIVLARKAVSISPPDNVGAWLYGVAYRTALKARALFQRRKRIEGDIEEVSEIEDTRKPQSDLESLLDRELQALPEHYRLAIVLCDLEGKTHKQAALQLGCPISTISARLYRGRSMLASRLARKGLGITVGSMVTVCSAFGSSSRVPEKLATATAKGCSGWVAGLCSQNLTDNAIRLAQGVLHSMFLKSVSVVATITLAIGCVVGLGFGAVQSDLTKPIPSAFQEKHNEEVTTPRAPFPNDEKARSAAPIPPAKPVPHRVLKEWGEVRIRQSSVLIVQNQKDYEKLFGETVAKFYSPRPKLPKVNFDKEQVVVIAWGDKPSGDYEVGVSAISRDKKGINMLVKTSTPKGPADTEITYPAAIVVIPRTPHVTLVITGDRNPPKVWWKDFRPVETKGLRVLVK